jgi:hypothetical protein
MLCVADNHRDHFWPPSAEINFGLMIVNSQLDNMFLDCVLTYGREGQHSAGSCHYTGHAVDIRIPTQDTNKRKTAFERCTVALPATYQLVDEGSHWHLEFDPRQPMNKYKWEGP